MVVRSDEVKRGRSQLPRLDRTSLASLFEGVLDSVRIERAGSMMRSSEEVMVPSVLRHMRRSRFSFADTMVSRIVDQGWRIRLAEMDIDGQGFGTLIYEAEAGGQVLSFCVKCQPDPQNMGEGRLREETFDFLGTLIEGVPDREYVRREFTAMESELWRGRAGARTLGWSFANKSRGFFFQTVEALSSGRLPDGLMEIGYLIRNAGFYGNGRHGSRTWSTIPEGHPLDFPYHVDLLCLYFWKLLGPEVVEATAAARSRDAIALPVDFRRSVGVGNSSGIGTVAALVRWPTALSSYVFPREFVLGYARSDVDRFQADRIAALEEEVIGHSPSGAAEHGSETGTGQRLLEAIADASTQLGRDPLASELWQAVENRVAADEPTMELFVSSLPAAYPELVEPLRALLRAMMMSPRLVDPLMSVGELGRLLRARYEWALKIDFSRPGAFRYFWYKSEENGENRRGERGIDPGEGHETFVNVAGSVQSLALALEGRAEDELLGEMLIEHPGQAMAASRVQVAGSFPYSEIESNLVCEDLVPAEVIRFFLAILGISRSRAKSDLWVQGTFFERTPVPGDWNESANPAEVVGAP